MTKHKSILTDAEIHTLISGNPFTLGLSIARLKDFIRQVERAVQAKLADQHTPIAWLHEETGDVISSELKDDAPEMLKGYDVPLYKCPDFSYQGLLDSSNHIADMRKKVKENHIPDASKMVVPDGWQLVPKNANP